MTGHNWMVLLFKTVQESHLLTFMLLPSITPFITEFNTWLIILFTDIPVIILGDFNFHIKDKSPREVKSLGSNSFQKLGCEREERVGVDTAHREHPF